MSSSLSSPSRRKAFALAAASTLCWTAGLHAPASAETERLEPWKPGQLDIHHIAIGRGSATLVILPDGTSLLIDAGASSNSTDVSVQTRPNSDRRAGEWIARYARRHLKATGGPGIDYALISHVHPDHLGDVAEDLPLAPSGTYRLTGIAEVAEHLPIGVLLDRGYPDYAYPGDPLMKAPFAQNYRAFVAARAKAGGAVQRFIAGSSEQIRPLGRRPVESGFAVRNIAVNGQVWTGKGQESRNTFPGLNDLPTADFPNENMCSAAVRIESGSFRYFTGGDLTSNTFDGDQPWRDILGAAARVAGPVDVATADHHGLFDGVSGDVARALRPSAWVIPTWHVSHPSPLQLEHMFSERLYPGPRDVYATEVMRENLLINRRMLQRLKSVRGHVVVRVAPGGANFRVVVTDNSDEEDRVIRSTAYLTSSKP